jgi:hypothetical protein
MSTVRDFGAGEDPARRLDAWLALRWRQRPAATVVLAHAQRRWWPLLESVATVAWLHPGDDPRGDFHAPPGCRPALRFRLALSREGRAGDADALLRRADLRVLAVTDEPQAVADLLAPSAWRDGAGHTLLWGREASTGWAACDATARGLGLRPMPAPTGWRCLASTGLLHDATHPLPWTPQGVKACEEAWSQRAPLRRLAIPEPRWRLQLPGREAAVASSELAQQRILVGGRALADRRGNFGLIRPWDGPLLCRVLLPNLRARIDGANLYLPGGEALTARGLWKEGRLHLHAALPAVPEDQAALLHGTVPAWALPQPDFCELATVAWEWPA